MRSLSYGGSIGVSIDRIASGRSVDERRSAILHSLNDPDRGRYCDCRRSGRRTGHRRDADWHHRFRAMRLNRRLPEAYW